MTDDKILRSKRRKKILFACLGVSLTLHVVALVVIYTNPPEIRSGIDNLFGRALSFLDHDDVDLEKDKILEEVFEDFETLPPQFIQPFDKETAHFLVKARPLIEEVKDNNYTITRDSLSVEKPHLPVAAKIEDKHTDKVELLEEEAGLEDPAHPNKKSFYTQTLPQLQFENGRFESESSDGNAAFLATREGTVSQHPIGMSAKLPEQPIAHIELPKGSLSESPKQPLMVFRSFNDPIANWEPPKAQEPPVLKLENYALPEAMPSINWSQQFTTEVEVVPDHSGSGYLFSVTLNPNAELKAHKIKQNIIFMIDRSNSIEKHEYDTFKRAVSRSLPYLKEGDSFNIIVFDKKIHRLSEKNLPVSKKSIQSAEDFLDKEGHGRHFAAAEIYPVIEKALPNYLPEEEVNTAILLSDGNTLLTLKKQQKAMLSLIEKNSGKINLYSAAAGRDNNIVLLDLLSTYNRGSLIYSRTFAALPRKFVKAVMQLRDPIIKDINLKATTLNEESIELFPPSFRAPTLFYQQPYVIMGKTEKLTPFTLLLDGRNGDQWVSVKKEINLSKAKKGKAGLEQKWAHQEAQGNYGQFLKEGKGDYLKKAKETLKVSSEIYFE